MKQGIIRKITGISIASVAISILIMASIGCTKTIVKREFVMSGSARHQALVDSLNTQIRDCENALGMHEKAKGREF